MAISWGLTVSDVIQRQQHVLRSTAGRASRPPAWVPIPFGGRKNDDDLPPFSFFADSLSSAKKSDPVLSFANNSKTNSTSQKNVSTQRFQNIKSRNINIHQNLALRALLSLQSILSGPWKRF